MGTSLRRLLLTWLLAAASAPLHAEFHLWILDEVFSSADGTVQYVELRALSGGQQFLAGHAITAGTGPSARAYTFPSNLPGDTTGKRMLIGTASFAALGIVTPDYVVPDNFLDVPSGTMNFAGVDTWNYGPMPTDGALALYRNGTSAARTPTNFAGQTIVPPNPPRLSNISTRMNVGQGFDVMIGGFVISGGSKTVAVVATGPSLGAFGIQNFLANPKLTLVRSSDQAVIATNDDWQGGCPPGFACADSSGLTAAKLSPSHPLEPAILINLPPGAYTAIVEGVNGGTGVSVVAVYEVEEPTVPLINIATRGRVGTGFDVMIGGFVITGSSAQTVAIVATGPSLGAFGIQNFLANPKLTLVRQSDGAVVGTNDDWQAGCPPGFACGNSADLTAAKLAPTETLEAAIYITLQPGAYTAIVEDATGGTGVAVIGVYKVD